MGDTGRVPGGDGSVVRSSKTRVLRAGAASVEGGVGAQSGARGDLSDPELAEVVRRWADLPAAMRAGIIAMVRSIDSA